MFNIKALETAVALLPADAKVELQKLLNLWDETTSEVKTLNEQTSAFEKLAIEYARKVNELTDKIERDKTYYEGQLNAQSVKIKELTAELGR